MPRNDQRWRDSAACQGEDTNLFFPAEVSRTDNRWVEQTREALAICKTCEVRDDCLADYAWWAKQSGVGYAAWTGSGIFGNTMASQRRQMKWMIA